MRNTQDIRCGWFEQKLPDFPKIKKDLKIRIKTKKNC